VQVHQNDLDALEPFDESAGILARSGLADQFEAGVGGEGGWSGIMDGYAKVVEAA